MKMMGVNELSYWASWCIKYFTILTVASIILTIATKVSFGIKDYRVVFQNTDFSILFVFLILYTLSTITFTMAVTAPCSKSKSYTLYHKTKNIQPCY